jgi:3-oxoacyl-[acyl-carrier protein] reductase
VVPSSIRAGQQHFIILQGENLMSIVETEHPYIETRPEDESYGVLRDKTALVTGGSRGIGKATALALAQMGANIAVNYQSSAQAADDVCTLASEFGASARSFRADVSRADDAEAMVEAVLKEFGGVDILVNNAGITRDKSFLKMTRDMWDEVLGVNLTGSFTITHAVMPGMIAGGWGRVINVASIVGQMGAFGQTNYSVTKAGLIGFTMSLAREVARKGITVNAVAPGYIETDMTKDVPALTIEAVTSMTPLNRLGKPEEVAAAIAFLASPKASYITGQVIAVNGGMYM